MCLEMKTYLLLCAVEDKWISKFCCERIFLLFSLLFTYVTDYSMEKGEQLYEHMIKESKKAGPDWQDVAEYYADKIGEISFFHVTLGLENELEVRYNVFLNE